MPLAFIRHHVVDYPAWRAVYDAFTARGTGGNVRDEPLVYRSVDDPNDLLVIHSFADEAEISPWRDDPGRRRAMLEAGVEGTPRVDICLDPPDEPPGASRPASLDASAALEATERERLRALVARDMDRAWELHAEDFQLVTPHGATLSREEYLGSLTSGQLAYQSFDMISVASALTCEHLGLLRYKARIDRTYDGVRQVMQAWHTDCYRRTGRSWQSVQSQATAVDTD